MPNKHLRSVVRPALIEQAFGNVALPLNCAFGTS